MNITTYHNRIVVRPDEIETKVGDIFVSEDEVKGTLSGIVIAVADNISDIDIGEHIFYAKSVEKILIKEEEYHILPYNMAYYTDTVKKWTLLRWIKKIIKLIQKR